MIASPIVTVVSKPAARKLAISLTGCGARSEISTTAIRIGQKADAIASGIRSFMCRPTVAVTPDECHAIRGAEAVEMCVRSAGGSLMPEPSTAAGRARARVAALQLRAERMAERAKLERSRHSSLDALFEMVDRDAEVGGGIMAGALAYRLFIWLLPLALVLIAGLGVISSAESSSPESVARSTGLTGLVSSSVANAADSSARWYALLVGIPILLYATRSVLSTLIVVHRLVWTDLRAQAPRPTVKATVRLLGILLAMLGCSVVAAAARTRGPLGLATLAATLPSAALWLLVTANLPRRDATWRALLPGAFLFGLGIEVLHLVTVYLIAPLAGNKQGTYGSLGLAAALLLDLFLMSRLVVATAVVNATLWERRQARSV